MKSTSHVCAVVVLVVAASGVFAAAPAHRAANYKEALARAKQTGEDIVVYQRGSDWSHLGELLLAEVWNRPEFAEAVGPGVNLVVVDNPESPGAAPVSPYAPEDAVPDYSKARATPVQRLRSLADEDRAPPAGEIEQVTCVSGSAFTRRADGCFVASGAAPAQEVMTLRVKATRGGRVLRLDFPLDDSLPGRGPGRAHNGNFVLSEVEVDGMQPISAWANVADGNCGAWQAIDGVAGKPDNCWNPIAHQHRQRTLLVVLDKPVLAGASLSVRLISKSQWGEHVPGGVSAAVLNEPAVEADVLAAYQAEREIADNAAFGWRGGCTPRIAFMDREGRPVACEDKPRHGLTPATLAARVCEIRAVRVRRDALWAKAEHETGPRRAELYLEGLLAMGDDIAFDGAYRPIQDKITAADPRDVSACGRRLQFPPEPRNVPPMVADAYKLVDEKKFAEALAKLDAELRHPGNRRLSHEHVQRIMNGKFNVYRRWPGHEEQRFDIQRESYKFDPTTYWGLGAIGYLAMHDKTPEPIGLSYGWSPCHLKPGANAWTFGLDLAKYFDHAGNYTVRIIHKGGKDSVEIVRVRLIDGDTLLSEAAPAAVLAPNGNVEVHVTVRNWPPRAKLALRLDVRAEIGKLDAGGRFEVDPLL